MRLRFLLAASAVFPALAATSPIHIAARLAPITIPAHATAVTVEVNAAAARRELLAAANDRTRDILLDLDGIEAERSPEVYFEVYVHAKSAARGRSAGNVALFGSGIRSEARGEFHPAHVQLVITDQVRAALGKSSRLAVTFVAQGAGGSAAAPRSASALTIGKPSIIIAPRTRDACGTGGIWRHARMFRHHAQAPSSVG